MTTEQDNNIGRSETIRAKMTKGPCLDYPHDLRVRPWLNSSKYYMQQDAMERTLWRRGCKKK